MHIVAVTRSSKFPRGMAASQRITMIGRAALAGGHSMHVLCPIPLETDPAAPLPHRGEHHGIGYEYTSGTSVRSASFIMRRWHHAKGTAVAFCRILHRRAQGRLDLFYIYDRAYHLNYQDMLFILFARMLGTPVIREMNERPWSLKEAPSLAERVISPLWGVNGVIAISTLITDWVLVESEKRGTGTAVVHIPVLTDIDETGTNHRGAASYVLFAGAPAYDETVRFILDAMEFVWRSDPDCTLYLTGFRRDDAAGKWIAGEAEQRQAGEKIRICGYLARPELLDAYAGAKALLIPLFDDLRSRARFPTKISEYLASSAPVITSSVGEIPRYLQDGNNAFVARPGDPASFGGKILECLGDPERARKIGARGRFLAERSFHYGSYARALDKFLGEVGAARR